MAVQANDRTILLSARSLSVGYTGGIRAVEQASIEIKHGETCALLGANGAGKTTLIRAIGGFWQSEPGRISSGSVHLDGENVTGLSPTELVRRGVALVPQDVKVFNTLTVKENLDAVPRLGSRRGRLARLAEIYDLFPVLSERASQHAGYLSGGEKQMLGVARGLLLNPRLLLIDEASLGLAPRVIRSVFDRLRDVQRAFGMAMLIAEQNIPAVALIAHRAYVLDAGSIVASAPIEEIMGNEQMMSAYLGIGRVSETH